uniref:Chemosensory protein 5 n=1 Tax=Riptortus pedestris TaxID=329032 RepID=A0A2Z4HQ04_RIPPE|nr:chemosensory protein 5 [Riptortus pedestris]
MLSALLGALLLASAAVSAPAEMSQDEKEVYERIFNDADVDIIVNNDRILDMYLRCFFNEGPCTTLGKEIKGKISEVFSDVCGRCTLHQKRVWRHAMDIFIPKRPKDWERILSIYDPDGSYWPGIKAFLEGPAP